jgi:hypothetical protein
MKNTILFSLFICFFVSCNDQIKTEFKNYKSASENKFFDKGWIPNNLIYKSMTNINVKNNIDLNSVFFSYNLSSFELENLKKKIKKTDFEFRNPEKIDIPNELSKKISETEIFYIIENTDTTYVSIQNESMKVFGWSYNK